MVDPIVMSTLGSMEPGKKLIVFGVLGLIVFFYFKDRKGGGGSRGGGSSSGGSSGGEV